MKNKMKFISAWALSVILVFGFGFVLPAKADSGLISCNNTTCNFGTMTQDSGGASALITFTNDSGDGSTWTPNVGTPTNLAFSVNNDGCSGQSLSDGSSCQVTVDFDPSNLSGNVSGSLDIDYTSSSGSGDTVTYNFTANVTGASGTSGNGQNSSSSEQTLDFGTLTSDAGAQSKLLTITNNSSNQWEITNIGQPSDPSFTIGDNTGGQQDCDGVTLTPPNDSSCVIDYDFEPSQASGKMDETSQVSYNIEDSSGNTIGTGTINVNLLANVSGSGGGSNGGGNNGNSGNNGGNSGSGNGGNSGNNGGKNNGGNSGAGNGGTGKSGGTGSGNGGNNGNGGSNPPSSTQASGCQSAGTICNPLQVSNIPDLIVEITKILMDLLGIASVLMIVIAGFRMVIAAGNSEAVEKARTQLTWSIVGLAVAALAYSIIAIISGLLKNT